MIGKQLQLRKRNIWHTLPTQRTKSLQEVDLAVHQSITGKTNMALANPGHNQSVILFDWKSQSLRHLGVLHAQVCLPGCRRPTPPALNAAWISRVHGYVWARATRAGQSQIQARGRLWRTCGWAKAGRLGNFHIITRTVKIPCSTRRTSDSGGGCRGGGCRGGCRGGDHIVGPCDWAASHLDF